MFLQYVSAKHQRNLRRIYIYIYIYKIKWSRYRPGVARRVGRGIALLFHDRGTRRGWVVSSTPLPHFTPSKDPVPILQEAGWAPGSVWTGGKSRRHRDSIPKRPARSQSLYRLSYPAHTHTHTHTHTHIYIYIYMYIKFDVSFLPGWRLVTGCLVVDVSMQHKDRILRDLSAHYSWTFCFLHPSRRD